MTEQECGWRRKPDFRGRVRGSSCSYFLTVGLRPLMRLLSSSPLPSQRSHWSLLCRIPVRIRMKCFQWAWQTASVPAAISVEQGGSMWVSPPQCWRDTKENKCSSFEKLNKQNHIIRGGNKEKDVWVSILLLYTCSCLLPAMMDPLKIFSLHCA